MTKSELIDRLAKRFPDLAKDDVFDAVNLILSEICLSLAKGKRIEIRGCGCFNLHYRPPRKSRNPKNGDPVKVPGKYVPHFKPGKELRERVMDAKGANKATILDNLR